jgi:hypothetical protein
VELWLPIGWGCAGLIVAAIARKHYRETDDTERKRGFHIPDGAWENPVLRFGWLLLVFVLIIFGGPFSFLLVARYCCCRRGAVQRRLRAEAEQSRSDNLVAATLAPFEGLRPSWQM